MDKYFGSWGSSTEGFLDRGHVFERAACGCFENTAKFHARLDTGMVDSGDSLRDYLAGVRSLRMSSSWRRLYSRSQRHARHPCLRAW